MAKQAVRKKKTTTTAARKKTPARKTAARKTVAKKSAGKKVAKKAAKKAPTKKKTAKKSTQKKLTKKTAKKAAAKKAPSKKVTKKAAAKKTGKKAVAKKSGTKKAAAKKTVTKKGPVKKAAKKAASKTTTKKPARRKPARKKAKRKINGSAAMDGDWLPEGYEARVELPAGYQPTRKEQYMCAEHIEYFRRKLYRWRQELVDESQQTIDHLRSEVRDVGDEAERATRETENSLELRTRDRYRKLILKVDQAIKRLEKGDYGYCEETDEEIGLARLEARPIATLSLDAQERRELKQRQLSQ